MSAILDETRTYRYQLTRPGAFTGQPAWLWVMLNPSTADEESDDATIRKCNGIQRQQTVGHRGDLTVVNLFALRATDPKLLRSHPDPVGPQCDDWLCAAASDTVRDGGRIIVAWGAHPFARRRARVVTALLRTYGWLWCLGTTKDGSPPTPLVRALLAAPGPMGGIPMTAVRGRSRIEWTDMVWNPVTGCDRVSPGCDHCYAATMANRLKGMGQPRYQRDGDPRTSGPGFGVTLQEDVLNVPLRWTRPRRVFVNSMSDLFHQDIPDDFIARVFAVMALADQHTFQVLTKRHGRMRGLLNTDDFRREVAHEAVALTAGDADLTRRMERWPGDWWPLPNVWLGVSVENQQWANIRIPALMSTPAAVRFLSCEPLIGPVDLESFALPDWVIVGGESGAGARPMHPDWVRHLRDQCTEPGFGPLGVAAFFFKQWGVWGPTNRVGAGVGAADEVCLPDSSVRQRVPGLTEGRWFRRVSRTRAGRELDGRTWDEFPAAAS